MKASVSLNAPAKINLTLEVLARQENGLHALRSVMVPLDLCDEITIAPAPAFSFDCDEPSLREGNLVERAIRAVAPDAKVAAELRKEIPSQAGLGGGSSDAAAILLAAQRGVFGSLPAQDYLAIARSLGSDVPFFLAQTAALVEGTGERVTALGAAPPWHAIVVKPPAAISTADAYARLDSRERQQRPRSSSVSVAMGEALQRGEFDRVIELMQNDFHEEAVSRTAEVETAVRALSAAGASKPLLCGSGSSVFALARDEDERDRLRQRLSVPEDYKVFACAFNRSGVWQTA